jgi:hypothetical protein
MRRSGLLVLVAGLMGLALLPSVHGSRAGDPTSDPDRVAYLRKQFALFQSLPPARQQQIRELDQQLHTLDEAKQQRLRRVLEEYTDWLSRLSDEDRKRVTSAPGAVERLVAIKELREREWLESLPQAYRELHKAAKTYGEKADLVMRWRQEEQDREEEWQIAQKSEIKSEKFSGTFQNPEFHAQIEEFMRNLEPGLMDQERKRLRAAQKAGDEGNWIHFGRVLVRLSDDHPLLPAATPGPKTYEALPSADKEKLPRQWAKELPRSLETYSGRWPDFAVAVAKHAREKKITLPEPLGTCRKDQMPAEVQRFIDDTLARTLGKTEAGKRELEHLKQAEGQWPDYPATLMRLAKQEKLPVPGWTLPGKPDWWNVFRAKPIRPSSAAKSGPRLPAVDERSPRP